MTAAAGSATSSAGAADSPDHVTRTGTKITGAAS